MGYRGHGIFSLTGDELWKKFLVWGRLSRPGRLLFAQLLVAVTGLFWKFYIPRTAFAGNATLVESVCSNGNDRLARTTAEQTDSNFLYPVDVVRVGEHDFAINFKM